MAATGVDFIEGQAMSSRDVAREGLQRLPHGPLHIAGDGNRMAEPLLRGTDRRQSVALMTAGAAALYGLKVPTLPAEGED